MKNKAYITAYQRTPFGAFGGSLKNYSAIELGVMASTAMIEKYNIDSNKIDEVIYGNVLSAGLGQSPARQIGIKSGISMSADAYTINKVCASGMKSIGLAYQSIILNDKKSILTGGTESMSNVPHYSKDLRWGNKLGHTENIDGLLYDGLTDPYNQAHMGVLAELTVKKYGISREEQDAYAIESYKKAKENTENGILKKSICIVKLKGEELIDYDEDIYKLKIEKVPNLKPNFMTSGTITAANASNLNDGAVSILVENSEYIDNKNNIYEILDYVDVAQNPKYFSVSPSLAIQKILERNKMQIKDIDYFEINEAYASVAIINSQICNIPLEKLNIYGGAIAMGHPLGASGARIVINLITALELNDKEIGIASICNGGGSASAILIRKK